MGANTSKATTILQDSISTTVSNYNQLNCQIVTKGTQEVNISNISDSNISFDNVSQLNAFNINTDCVSKMINDINIKEQIKKLFKEQISQKSGYISMGTNKQDSYLNSINNQITNLSSSNIHNCLSTSTSDQVIKLKDISSSTIAVGSINQSNVTNLVINCIFNVINSNNIVSNLDSEIARNQNQTLNGVFESIGDGVGNIYKGIGEGFGNIFGSVGTSGMIISAISFVLSVCIVCIIIVIALKQETK